MAICQTKLIHRRHLQLSIGIQTGPKGFTHGCSTVLYPNIGYKDSVPVDIRVFFDSEWNESDHCRPSTPSGAPHRGAGFRSRNRRPVVCFFHGSQVYFLL